jgi:pyridoxamine 5'-phosphate oxidase
MEEFIRQIHNDHRDFDSGKLEGYFGDSPISLFNAWYFEAIESKHPEPNAMVLSTVGSTNRPSSRVLYLKDIKDDSLLFFTNYNSHKAKDLIENPQASLLFFWPKLERQIRIEGVVEKVSNELSDAYFNSRPRGSQIGAWASNQSELLTDRKELEDRIDEFATKFPNEVPRPDFWGGYQLKPDFFEFWQGRSSRLHDRIIFEKEKDHWNLYRKNP